MVRRCRRRRHSEIGAGVLCSGSLLGHLLPAVPQAHALEDRILDQEQAIPANAVGERAPLQVGTDRDDRVAALECRSLEYLEDLYKPLGVRELEILELLGQARMHIVSKLEPEQGLEVVAPEYRLFVGVHEVVTVSERRPIVHNINQRSRKSLCVTVPRAPGRETESAEYA